MRQRYESALAINHLNHPVPLYLIWKKKPTPNGKTSKREKKEEELHHFNPPQISKKIIEHRIWMRKYTN
jgi:hypothetical protein